MPRGGRTAFLPTFLRDLGTYCGCIKTNLRADDVLYVLLEMLRGAEMVIRLNFSRFLIGNLKCNTGPTMTVCACVILNEFANFQPLRFVQ